jgi:hypothetical protein
MTNNFHAFVLSTLSSSSKTGWRLFWNFWNLYYPVIISLMNGTSVTCPFLGVFRIILTHLGATCNNNAHLDSLHQDAGWVAYVMPGTSTTKLPSLNGTKHRRILHNACNSPESVSPLLSLFCCFFFFLLLTPLCSWRYLRQYLQKKVSFLSLILFHKGVTFFNKLTLHATRS